MSKDRGGNDSQRGGDNRRGRNNFDSVYDAKQYGCGNNGGNVTPNYNNTYQQPPSPYGQNTPPRNYQPNPQDTYQTMGSQPLRERPNSHLDADKHGSTVEGGDSGANNVTIMSPKDYVDVKHLIDNLRLKQAVIVDLIKIEAKDGQRVLDFLSGAIYALGGSQQRISQSIFLFTPGGVAIKLPPDLEKQLR